MTNLPSSYNLKFNLSPHLYLYSYKMLLESMLQSLDIIAIIKYLFILWVVLKVIEMIVVEMLESKNTGQHDQFSNIIQEEST